MIRAAGIVAVLAGILLLTLLLHASRSVELAATVLSRPSAPASASSGPAVYVRSRYENIGSLEDAGIIIDPRIDIISRREGAFWMAVAKEVEDAAKPDDQLLIRSKRMGLSFGSRIVHWTSVHYELRRGAEVRSFNGPENRAYILVFAAVPAGPLALWGLAAGILTLARPRRGPSTTPPGSPGTPGSP
jgi:hypothetical protein